jgi:outer membrane protein assembly factor BamB
MPITSSASEEPGMPPSSTLEPRRLRLWPAIGISFLMLAACFGTGFVIPGTIPQFMAMLWGPMIGGPLMVLWWLFFSRAPWTDRVVGLALLAAVAAATYYLAHPTAKPLGLLINGVPTVSAIMVAWLWLMDGRVSQSIQRWSSAVLLIIATGIWGCIRVDGIDGSLSSYLSWRWSPTKEEQFLASSPKEDIPDAAVASTEPLVAEPGDWPGFRGLQRDSIVSNQKFVTDWKSNPPKEIWRRPIGPAWSSFCVIGNLAFTQEQRDQEEAVVCYDTENTRPGSPSSCRVSARALHPRFTKGVFTPWAPRGRYPRSTPPAVNSSGAATWFRIPRPVFRSGDSQVPPWSSGNSLSFMGEEILRR